METYCPEVKHLSLTSVSWGLMTSVCLYFCLRPWWSAALKDTVWLWLTKSLWICHMCIHVWWDCCVRSFMTDAFKFSIYFFFPICLWLALDLTHWLLLFKHSREHLHLPLRAVGDLNPDSAELKKGFVVRFSCLYNALEDSSMRL